MAEPFLAEIRLFSFGEPPQGWARCDGQLLPINQNQALFSLLGTTYGGNGQTTFALPDLRGRCATHFGNGHEQGHKGGEETHSLTAREMPQHTHLVNAASAPGDRADASGSMLAGMAGGYGPPTAPVSLHPTSVSEVGSGKPHPNMSPYLALNFCIALQGIFPSRS